MDEVKIVGVDADGDKVARYTFENGTHMNYPLTPCCEASGKGGQYGIICRRCYMPVDAKFGGVLADEDIRSAN